MSTDDRFDEVIGESLSAWGQRVSRRGWLAKASKLLLWAGGVTITAPLLPLDRVVAQGVSCSDWRLQGIYGYLCQNCCNGTASLTTCPGCTTRGGAAWVKCCEDAVACPPIRRMVQYFDCCSSSSAAASCQGQQCLNNSEQPAWCPSGEAYRCTVISVGAAC